MKYIEIKAPAKINIGLSVLSKREDGFHNLSTLFYPISDLYDLLTFELSDRFIFDCDSDTIPVDSGNIVVKAKDILESASGKKINVKITLKKRIPSQAGLGGGSSDAAAVLISLNEMFQLGFNHEQIIRLALEAGSDVPFFVKSKPAIGKSRGEILEYLDLEIAEPVLIINPGINISTKEAFRNVTAKNIDYDFHSFIKNSRLDYSSMRQVVINDFEDYVFGNYPEIGKIKDTLYESGALFALMSGSGSTVYGIFPDVQTAEEAKQRFPKNYFSYLSTRHY